MIMEEEQTPAEVEQYEKIKVKKSTFSLSKIM